MVTGELPARPALFVSLGLMVGVSVATWFLNPWSVVPIVLGVGLNVLYEYAKAWSLWGNLVFGLTIGMCTVYGYLAAGPVLTPFLTSNRYCAFALVVLLNGLMTFYTYFKDWRGDRRAGKRTLVVRLGLRRARYAGVVGAFLPTLAFLLCHAMAWLPLGDVLYLRDFVFCATITVFLQFWTAMLFFQHPVGERTYFALATNTRACVAGQITIIAIFNGTLSLYLLAASYVFIGFLFDLHKDAKA